MAPRRAPSGGPRRQHRLLRLVLRLDQAGSAAFIVVALAAAPLLGLLAAFPAARWALGVLFIGYAVALAALGVCMAYGLSRSMCRGEDLPAGMWVSLLMFRPAEGDTSPRRPRPPPR
ncbi:hypothetical protein [Gandjariella thermophila]|uniref:Uncharacterized protein n=1 Tax=Gandjariella thermophila TaxID=1931992 RepID=A0A4D4J4S1_9PSEU|nr:hypothetical protein [Gandjariella thermophila]GDY31675.1 hypothetical protein GTS_33080 [Gandjariella thermophila]